MNQNIKIAFFDIDGTLASNLIKSDNIIDRIPESAKKTIIELEKNGIKPMIATGRGRLSIISLVEALNMDSYISGNGQSIVYQGKEIHKQFLSIEEVKEIVNQIMKYDSVSIMLETTKGNVLVRQAKNTSYILKEYYADLKNDVSKAENYDTYEVTIFGEGVYEDIHIDIPGIKGRMIGKKAMSIFPDNVSKATAIKKVLDIFSLTMDQAIAFGDEENDLEMFRAVSNSVAMGVSNQELKKMATYVTDTVEDDGIYKACQYFKLVD